jgi:hypothetical protein
MGPIDTPGNRVAQVIQGYFTSIRCNLWLSGHRECPASLYSRGEPGDNSKLAYHRYGGYMTRRQRMGITVCILYICPIGIAIAAAWLGGPHLPDLSTIAEVMVAATSAPAVPMLYLTWRTHRDGSAQPGLSLPGLADELSKEIGRQWEKELRLQRLHDPDPLPVSLESAPLALAESSARIKKPAFLRQKQPRSLSDSAG